MKLLGCLLLVMVCMACCSSEITFNGKMYKSLAQKNLSFKKVISLDYGSIILYAPSDLTYTKAVALRDGNVIVRFTMGVMRLEASSIDDKFYQLFSSNYDMTQVIVDQQSGQMMDNDQYFVYRNEIKDLTNQIPDMEMGDYVTWSLDNSIDECLVQSTPMSAGDNENVRNDYLTTKASCEALRYVWGKYFS